jgi:hypothetical protein
VLFVTVVFGVLGLGLVAMGRWGSRGSVKLSVVPGYDQKSIQLRRAALRRGAYACYVAGGMFIVLAMVALFFRDSHLRCPPSPAPGQCTAACAAAHRCQPVPLH